MPDTSRAIDNCFKGCLGLWCLTPLLTIFQFISWYLAIRGRLETASHDNTKAEGLAKIALDGHVLMFLLLLKVCTLLCNSCEEDVQL